MQQNEGDVTETGDSTRNIRKGIKESLWEVVTVELGLS